MSTSTIKIGILTTLFGPFEVLGRDALRGVDLALRKHNFQVAGHPVEIVVEGTDATPDSAIEGVDMLFNEKGVDFVIGPLSGTEGLAVAKAAPGYLGRTFINGASAAQDIKLRASAKNFFSFATNGVQWMAGLGTYVYEELGYKRIAYVSENYSYPHSQVAGFKLEYCKAGGHIVASHWVPLATSDYRAFIKNVPDDIDALMVVLGGTDAVNFISQYQEQGKRKPLIGGSITVDQMLLSMPGIDFEPFLGLVSAGPIADDNPSHEWKQFVVSYNHCYPDAYQSPSLFAYGYYVNTIAALLALDLVGGDLSDGHVAFQNALRSLDFMAPSGRIRLDFQQQAISSNYVTTVAKLANGKYYNKLVKALPNVNQTLGMDVNAYLAMGAFNKSNPPDC